jgi:hypothetical protein
MSACLKHLQVAGGEIARARGHTVDRSRMRQKHAAMEWTTIGHNHAPLFEDRVIAL